MICVLRLSVALLAMAIVSALEPLHASEWPSKSVPVTNMGTGTQMIAIKRALPAKTLAEFIAYAKANPGKFNFTVAGTQNISHLAPALLFARAGIDLTMVPAKSEPQAIADLLSGQ